MCMYLDQKKGLEEGKKENQIEDYLFFANAQLGLPLFTQDSISWLHN